MNVPFDLAKLDRLMVDADIELVLASSPHNTRYLCGGYRFLFHDHHQEAVGMDRYLPFVGYPRNDPERAFYTGTGLESWQIEHSPLWLGEFISAPFNLAGSTLATAQHLRGLGLADARIGIERAFLPVAAIEGLREELPGATFVDAYEVLEELRIVKRPDELELLNRASRGVAEAMEAVFAGASPGDRKDEIVEKMRVEQTVRGLSFNYCWISTGLSDNMAHAPDPWESGSILCLDSAGQYRGYIGDLTRMGCMGEPTPLMCELLDEVDAVQRAARAVVAPGRSGAEVYAAAMARRAESKYASSMVFAAHGMGLVVHEAPRISDQLQPPYPATHRERPLEEGMVLSVETEVMHSEAGFVKLEDTVAVTADGSEGFGDAGRRWNIPNAAA